MRNRVRDFIAGAIASLLLLAPVAWAVTAVFPQQGGTGNSIIPAKGMVLIGSTTSFQPLAIGSDGQVLTADSGHQWGARWQERSTTSWVFFTPDSISPSSTVGVTIQTVATTTNLTVTSISGLVKCNGESQCAAGVSGTDYDTAAAWNTNANATSYVQNIINASSTLPQILAGGFTGVAKIGSGKVLVQAVSDTDYQRAITFTANDFDYVAPTLSIDYTNGQASNGSTKGFLVAADWTTFNGKISTVSADTTPKLGGNLNTNLNSIGWIVPESDNDWSGDTVTAVAFVTFSAGDFAFCNTYQTDAQGKCKFDQTDGNTASTMPAIAMATAAITSGNVGTFLARGYWRDNDSTWTTATTNRFVYPSGTAGAQIQNPPNASGDQQQRACTIISATILWCDFDSTVVQP